MNSIKSRYVNMEQQKRINDNVRAAEYLYEAIKGNCHEGRERRIALQKVEEAVMWANKAIAYEELNDRLTDVKEVQKYE